MKDLLQRIMIRHTKIEVANEITMPGRESRLVYMPMSQLQRESYDHEVSVGIGLLHHGFCR
jgi:hypothetical protein